MELPGRWVSRAVRQFRNRVAALVVMELSVADMENQDLRLGYSFWRGRLPRQVSQAKARTQRLGCSDSVPHQNHLVEWLPSGNFMHTIPRIILERWTVNDCLIKVQIRLYAFFVVE